MQYINNFSKAILPNNQNYFEKCISELREKLTNHLITLSGFNTLIKENNYVQDFKNLSYKQIKDLENNESNNIIVERK